MLDVTEGLVLADRYVVAHKLGMGGSGTVWLAHDRVLDRRVAVKVVEQGLAAARLAREARATAGIGVRNVVGVYDVGEQDGAHFLVMEYVDGVDLATLLAATGPLSPELTALVGLDIARGVGAVHTSSLIHRDVTPANVLVTREGEVKLTDLGIAQRTGEEATRRLTEIGTVVGTVDYLAPEQVEGREVSAASDVYAVGLLLHTVSTGRPPFGDGSVSERLARRLATDPDRLGPEHGGLAAVVARAVRRTPTERYHDGAALRDALAPLVPDDDKALRQALAGRVRQAAEADPLLVEERTDALMGIAIGQHRPSPSDGTPPDERPEPRADDRPEPPEPPVDEPAAPVEQPRRSPPSSADATTVLATTPAAGAASADAGSADAAAVADADRGPGGGVLRPIAAAVGGILVVVAVASGLLAGFGDGGNGGNAGGDQDAATTVPIVSADDHDPLGGGTEHGEDVGLAIDGDAATEWDTEGYNSAALGGLKSGVGLLLDLGESVEVGAVEIDLGIDGVTLVVTVSEDRPDGDPTESATVLGTASDAAGTARVTGEDAVTGRWVALWFTELARPGDGGRFRAAVRDVRVLAP